MNRYREEKWKNQKLYECTKEKMITVKEVDKTYFDLCKNCAIEDGYSHMLIETQNINVTACKFYKKQGAVLSKVDMYAYYSQPDSRDEIQFIMYLDL